MNGRIEKMINVSDEDKHSMYEIMAAYYDDVEKTVFLEDMAEKDWCILLCDEKGIIRGFSTQMLLEFQVDGIKVNGVFSGDTIVQREYWGNLELARTFLKFFVQFGKNYPVFYWFLISKGYKTYKMLPVYFNSYYPRYGMATPQFEKSVMDAFGQFKYPDQYDSDTGVIHYHNTKDKLKKGVADIDEKRLRDKHIEFFNQINPNHIIGDDLVCMTGISIENLRSCGKKFFGEIPKDV
jgi:hypothetical protein